MNSLGYARLALGCCAGAAAVWGTWHWRPIDTPVMPNHLSAGTARPDGIDGASTLTAALEIFASRLPFDDPGQEGSETTAQAPAMPAPTPVESAASTSRVVLTGTVLGRVGLAIVSGLPEVEGNRVLRVGESVGAVSLLRVDTDSAIVLVHGTPHVLRLPPVAGGSR